MTTRPETNEYAPYFDRYISLVPEGDLLTLLQRQADDFTRMLENVPPEIAEYRYSPEKWSLKEVIGHITDTERIMSYRALCIARGDRTPLPGYDDESYVANAEFGRFALADLLEEFKLVRQNTIAFLSRLKDEDWRRVGIANNHDTSARALGYIMAGHLIHHRAIIQERYLRDLH